MLQFWFRLTWSDPRRLSMQEMHHGRNPCALTGHCFDTLDCNMEYTCTGYNSKRVCLPAVRSDIVSIIYNMFQHRQRPCQTDSACFKILLLSMNELGVELFGAFLAEQAVFFVTRWKYLSDGTLCFAEGQMEAGTSTSSSAGGRPRRWPDSVFPIQYSHGRQHYESFQLIWHRVYPQAYRLSQALGKGFGHHWWHPQ